MKKVTGSRLENKARVRERAQDKESVSKLLAALLCVVSTHEKGDPRVNLEALCIYEGSAAMLAKTFIPELTLRRSGSTQVREKVLKMAPGFHDAFKHFQLPTRTPASQETKAQVAVHKMLTQLPHDETLQERWLTLAKVKNPCLLARTYMTLSIIFVPCTFHVGNELCVRFAFLGVLFFSFFFFLLCFPPRCAQRTYNTASMALLW